MRVKKKNKKVFAILFALIVAVTAIGGAIAYLTSRTEKVENTFSIGDISISLSESDDLDLQLIPRTTLKKDPKITVEDGSVNCYLFVELEKSENLDTFVNYELASGWLPVGDSYPNIYYREVTTEETPVTYSILKDDQVTIKDYTKNDISSVKPTLSFVGYAIQKTEIADAQTAWSELIKVYNDQ